jgi:signal transduction histidine kinase/type II secretory pathway pseudopilin PulG
MVIRFSTGRWRLLSRHSLLSHGLIAVLTGILALLAVLQYRWSGEVSEAERERMHKSVNLAARQFQDEYYHEMMRVGAAFQPEPGASEQEAATHLVGRFKDWLQSASRAQIVTNLFLWKPGQKGDGALLRLNPASMDFEPTVWPAKFESLRKRLATRREAVSRHLRGSETPPFAWTVAEEIPALVYPLLRFLPPQGDSTPIEPSPWGYCIVALNLNYLQSEFFPALAQRYFGPPQDSAYQIRIVDASEQQKVVYPPHVDGAGKDLLAGDAVVDLLEPRPEGPFVVRTRVQFEGQGLELGDKAKLGAPRLHTAFGFARRAGRPRPPVLVLGNPAGGWQLVVRHKMGSLEAFVAANRRRNLGLSFAILLLLAVSAVMVFVSTTRARRLAKLQMEFVAAVSHELRTPLTVICSAAHNLTTGIVGGKEQMQHYGAIVRREGMRLSRMVQQILLFTSNQAGGVHYDRRALRVAETIDSVLAESANMVEAAGYSVEKHIEPDLPLVLADPTALGHCMQNLLSNAVKYGGDRRWISVRARKVNHAPRPEVHIVVEDKGIGIDPSELKDIFKPFYRSKSVTAVQIPGTGLGLSVAKSIAEAMGGSLSVKSAPGQGSAFTLRLPAMKPDPQAEGQKAE